MNNITVIAKFTGKNTNDDHFKNQETYTLRIDTFKRDIVVIYAKFGTVLFYQAFCYLSHEEFFSEWEIVDPPEELFKANIDTWIDVINELRVSQNDNKNESEKINHVGSEEFVNAIVTNAEIRTRVNSNKKTGWEIFITLESSAKQYELSELLTECRAETLDSITLKPIKSVQYDSFTMIGFINLLESFGITNFNQLIGKYVRIKETSARDYLNISPLIDDAWFPMKISNSKSHIKD